MVPVLIAAAAGAVVGGTAVAVFSSDDKSSNRNVETHTQRVLSESQLPTSIRKKLEEKRNRSGDASAVKSVFVCSNSFSRDFSRIDDMLSRDENFDVIRDALQKIAKRADTHRNAAAMNKVGLYYQNIYDYDAANRCFERGKILARS